MLKLGKEFIWIKDCNFTQPFNKKLNDYQKKKNILYSTAKTKKLLVFHQTFSMKILQF